MALKPSIRYPAQTETGVAGYPQGKARNAGSFQDGTGTPFEHDWLNDLWGFEQALLDAAAVTPSGDPDEVGASQYLDALQSITLAPVTAAQALVLASARRRALADRALLLRRLDATGDDASDCMGASMVDGVISPASPVVLVKIDSAGTYLAFDSPAMDQGGVVPSITSLVCGAASNGSRIVVIGTGGNQNAYSDNAGVSWSAGGVGSFGAVGPYHLVYAPANALASHGNTFIAGNEAASAVYRSADASAWTSSFGGDYGFAGVLGLAVLGGATANKGYVVALGDAGIEPRLTLSTDGDGAVFTGSVAPPSAETAEEPGSIAGAPLVPGVGDHVYHVMRCNAGARLRTCSSPDGSTCTAGATIECPSGTSFSGRPRLMICQSTGLMVIAAPLDIGVTALYASLDFVEWVGPAAVKQIDNAAFAVAGGKLFMTRGSRFYASDGIVVGGGL